MKKKLISLLLAMAMLCSNLALPAAAQEPTAPSAPVAAQPAEEPTTPPAEEPAEEPATPPAEEPAAQPTKAPAATGEQAEPEEKPSTEESAEGKTDELAETVSGDWTYTVVDGMATITKYTGTDSDVTVPDTLDGLTVNCIGDEAFRSNESITAVTLPSSVTEIGKYTFYYCSNLETISMSGVETIGDYAFTSCTGIETLTLPKSLASIGKSSFSGLSNLTSLTINCNLEDMTYDDYTFRSAGSNASSLNVTFGSGVTRVPSCLFYDGYSKNTNYYPHITSVTLPSSVTEIGAYAFENCYDLKTISMSGVKTIGSYAFKGCTGIETLTLPKSLASIGRESFAGLSNLTSITINSNLEDLEWNAYAFESTGSNASSLKVTFGSGVTRVPSYLFHNNYSKNTNYYPHITSVTLPSSVTEIGECAFEGCYDLKTISMSGVKTIGSSAFYHCESLTGLGSIPALQTIGSSAFEGCTGIKTLNLPSKLTGIGYGAFAGMDSLTSLTIPASVTTIGSDAFKDAINLTSITINSNRMASSSYSIFSGAGSKAASCKVTFGSGITKVPDSLFEDSAITSVTLPSSVKSIGSWAFRNCLKLKTISMSGVEIIDFKAFYGCSSLTGLGSTPALQTIGSSAFEGCTGIKTLNLPAKLTTINDKAFSGLTNLTSLTVPASVTSIGNLAFANAVSLTNLTINGNLKDIYADTWLLSRYPDYDRFCSPFYAAGSKTAGLKVTFGSGVKRVPANLFATDYEKSSNVYARVTSVTLPEGVTTIGKNAFYNCYALKTLSMPISMDTVGKDAFINCNSVVVTPSAPSRPGNSFQGWYTAATGGTKVYSNTAMSLKTGKELHARWKPIIYTVKFNANGGTVSPASKTYNGNTAFSGSPVPKRTGYTFLGWFTAASGGTQMYSSTKVLKSMTVYAHWGKNCTITFNPNGGKVSTTKKTCGVGGTYGTMPTPTKSGYTFKGWSAGGVTYTSTSKVTGNKTLYAMWAKNCTITFNPNGGKVSPTKKTCPMGGVYGTLPTPTKTGYVFKGWSAGGVKYTSISKVTGNKTLYAMWVKECTIKFFANGGTVTPTSMVRLMNEPFGTLPTPAKTGYIFAGWFRNGVQVYSTTKVTGGAALYARWTKK